MTTSASRTAREFIGRTGTTAHGERITAIGTAMDPARVRVLPLGADPREVEYFAPRLDRITWDAENQPAPVRIVDVGAIPTSDHCPTCGLNRMTPAFQGDFCTCAHQDSEGRSGQQNPDSRVDSSHQGMDQGMDREGSTMHQGAHVDELQGPSLYLPSCGLVEHVDGTLSSATVLPAQPLHAPTYGPGPVVSALRLDVALFIGCGLVLVVGLAYLASGLLSLDSSAMASSCSVIGLPFLRRIRSVMADAPGTINCSIQDAVETTRGLSGEVAYRTDRKCVRVSCGSDSMFSWATNALTAIGAEMNDHPSRKRTLQVFGARPAADAPTDSDVSLGASQTAVERPNWSAAQSTAEMIDSLYSELDNDDSDAGRPLTFSRQPDGSYVSSGSGYVIAADRGQWMIHHQGARVGMTYSTLSAAREIADYHFRTGGPGHPPVQQVDSPEGPSVDPVPDHPYEVRDGRVRPKVTRDAETSEDSGNELTGTPYEGMTNEEIAHLHGFVSVRHAELVHAHCGFCNREDRPASRVVGQWTDGVRSEWFIGDCCLSGGAVAADAELTPIDDAIGAEILSARGWVKDDRAASPSLANPRDLYTSPDGVQTISRESGDDQWIVRTGGSIAGESESFREAIAFSDDSRSCRDAELARDAARQSRQDALARLDAEIAHAPNVPPAVGDSRRYMTGELPAIGDRVSHYVDSDTGTVTAIGADSIAVDWTADGEAEHHADECRLIRRDRRNAHSNAADVDHYGPDDAAPFPGAGHHYSHPITWPNHVHPLPYVHNGQTFAWDADTRGWVLAEHQVRTANQRDAELPASSPAAEDHAEINAALDRAYDASHQGPSLDDRRRSLVARVETNTAQLQWVRNVTPSDGEIRRAETVLRASMRRLSAFLSESGDLSTPRALVAAKTALSDAEDDPSIVQCGDCGVTDSAARISREGVSAMDHVPGCATGDASTSADPSGYTAAEFVTFLRSTLIPDLRDSGTDSIADDFETACRFIDRLSAQPSPDDDDMAELIDYACGGSPDLDAYCNATGMDRDQARHVLRPIDSDDSTDDID